MPYTSLACIVLAAGKSSRMGDKNKLLLPLQSSTVLGKTLSIYAGLGFGKLLCVTGRDHEQTSAIAQRYGVETLYNPDFMLGMAHSLRAGIQTISANDCAGILVALGDMPFFSQTSIHELCKAFFVAPKDAICMPTFAGQQGNPVLFSTAYKQDLMLLTGDIGAKSLLKKYAAQCICVEMPDNGCLRDIDTKDDWQQAQELTISRK